VRLPENIPSDLLGRRPDIRQQEGMLMAATARIGAARAAFFPSISLTGRSGFISSDFQDLFVDGANTWNFAGSLTQPIFEGGRLFALEKGLRETSTIERINALRDKHTIIKEYADELLHSYEFIMLLRIRHQFEQLKRGEDINNFVNPNTLSNLEKRIAKETFQLISKIQDLIIERYKAMIW
jgi:hypothetical protein